ncbi:ribonuclease J [Candidatus Nanogingivalis gingivitcus]|jgi:beta-lactamase domain protein|uniref:Ribonuclease J 1 n=1 Tax=Candidatus Nanogingivalis gingivitcus TaxID=2171992 RepID=A0ABY0FKX2_9BACT|nr:ribonuclease J [Candidatus Nanogingivalis gingivitcus]RYC72805.1 Ribonuclease J 1 [Candidatus Nanogingivalis gingivitcus]
MSDNLSDKAIRARQNLQKKAQDLAKNREKYVPKRNDAKQKAKKAEFTKKAAKVVKNNKNNSQNADAKKVNLPTTTRRGAVVRAQRMISNDINLRATQHIINIPVNKSLFNGFNGEQLTPTILKKLRPENDSVKIIPLGGLGEFGIGKNMFAIEYGNEILIIDMGSIFPNEDYPGVNFMTPDITYLEDNMHKVKAVAFTHAHLDHIGAVRQLLPKFGNLIPIYATDFTIGMIKRQMEEAVAEVSPNYQVVDPFRHEQIRISENLTLEFVHVLHSIPGCVAMIIRTPNGNIVHMGDWRFENDPIDTQFDMPRLAEVAQKEGIDLLMNESTNIDVPGTHPHSEYAIGESIGEVMDAYPHARLIISCFSSQIYRLQLILDEAAKHNRKVAFAGFSMINAVEIALRSKKIKVPKDTIAKMEDIVKMDDSKVTIVCTGSQGELNAVLNRMATGAHRFVKIKATDVVVFSSSPIPGNEPKVASTVDGLIREGAGVVQHGRGHYHGIGPLHLSGHAYYDDHVRLVETLRPKNYLPVHGEFYMLQHNAEMAQKVLGLKRERILVADSGDIIELTKNKTIKKGGRIHVGSILYDNTGNTVHDAVVKDRLHISTEGIFIIVLTINKKTGRLMKTPDVISRAFVYLKDSEELVGKIRHYLRVKTDREVGRQIDINDLKQEIKDDVSHLLFDSTGHTPIVIPVVNKV